MIDSAFFWSKRAGLGLTSTMSKAADELVEREHVAIVRERPAQEREIVQQSLADEAPLALQEQVGLGVALGELLVSLIAQHERHVREARNERRDAGVDERAIQRELARRGRHEVFAPDHMRDAHERVVDGVHERVERHSPGADDHEVGERSRREGHLAADQVDVGEVLVGDAQTPGGLTALGPERGLLVVGEIAVVVVVAELLRATIGLVAGVDLFGRRVALVHGTGLDELLEHAAIEVVALRLTVRSMRSADLDALVPVDLEPAQRIEQLVVALFTVTGGIRVFDAEHERATVVTGVRPVEQHGPDQPDVRKAGGRGAEAHAHVGAGGGRGAGIGCRHRRPA